MVRLETMFRVFMDAPDRGIIPGTDVRTGIPCGSRYGILHPSCLSLFWFQLTFLFFLFLGVSIGFEVVWGFKLLSTYPQIPGGPTTYPYSHIPRTTGNIRKVHPLYCFKNPPTPPPTDSTHTPKKNPSSIQFCVP
jgi:hypothetical protein